MTVRTCPGDQDKLIYLARRKKNPNMQEIGQVPSIPREVPVIMPVWLSGVDSKSSLMPNAQLRDKLTRQHALEGNLWKW